MADVQFEEVSGSKKRPVLFISEDVCIAITLKMTSHLPRDSSDYSLTYWAKAGLKKPTTVRTTKIIRLSESELRWKIGTVQDFDTEKIQVLLDSYIKS